jgi:arylsulfatase/uncharacterized sulfatase
MTMRPLLCWLLPFFGAFLLGPAAAAAAAPEAPRPNIVFVLADDVGFTDIEPYGSEIRTPTLRALAEEGLRFSNFHTAANCAPSRAMLLTGVNNHLAGVPNIPELLTPTQRQAANYQGVLSHRVVTVASLLEASGYHTYLAGKWHLGSAPDQRPSARGFERTFALMDSGADNWEQRPYLAIYDEANWFADGERTTLPEDFYSSEFLVDKTLEFIEDGLGDGRPFFAYLPFQAVHLPVQAPREYTERYLGIYDGGWDALREARRERAQAWGVIPSEVPMVRMESTADWDALDGERQRFEAKRMAVYAGMLEAMDFHLGRLVASLKARGLYENTIFIFTSDNGPEMRGPANPHGVIASRMATNLGYDQSYERLGERGSYNSISPSFASAAASPFAYYKFHVGEGGMRVPLIITNVPGQDRGAVVDAFSWATDIAPTLLAAAGVAPPEGRFGGRPVLPMSGKNLLPVLRGEASAAYGADESIGYELTGHGVLFQGDYKARRHAPPEGDGSWMLYNLVQDPGETEDLSAKEPERLARMIAAYEAFEASHGVQPLPAGYSQVGQLVSNMFMARLREPLLTVLLTALVLLAAAGWLRRGRSA